MKQPEPMHLQFGLLPQVIFDKYEFEDNTENGYAYIHINDGMYALPS